MDKNIYNKLKKSLGESDAQCECIEVFLRIAEDQYKEVDAFNELARRYKVAVNNTSTTEASQIARKGFIISVYRLFEVFLKEIIDIMKSRGSYGEFDQEKGESKLKCVYKRIFDISKHNEENYTLFLLCEYYRLIRNNQAHDAKEIEDLDKELVALKEQINKVPSSVCQKLNAPNSIDRIEFDDFILFSRAVKRLARNLFYGINFDIQKTAALFQVKKLKKNIKNVARVRQIIKSELKMQFYLPEEKENQIIDMIVNNLYNE